MLIVSDRLRGRLRSTLLRGLPAGAVADERRKQQGWLRSKHGRRRVKDARIFGLQCSSRRCSDGLLVSFEMAFCSHLGPSIPVYPFLYQNFTRWCFELGPDTQTAELARSFAGRRTQLRHSRAWAVLLSQVRRFCESWPLRYTHSHLQPRPSV